MPPDHLETRPEAVLDPEGFEGETWADALLDGDGEAARDEFVGTLRDGPNRTTPETDLIGLRQRWYGSDPAHRRSTDPDRAVDKYHNGVYGICHQFEGEIDWFANPTADTGEHDFTKEWQWQLNRHYQWVGLASAYDRTGDPKYASEFETQLHRWVESCPRPEHSGNEYPSAWRTIEAGIRSGIIWPYVFEAVRDSEDVADDTLWLWVCSFRDHGRHLLGHVQSGNWKMMEANGLTHVGSMFPELSGAGTFVSTGLDRTVAELERQFYPDGFQTELAPGYANVSITNAYATLSVAQERGGGSVPRRSWDRFETIAEGYGRLAAPNGECPPLHDSDHLDVGPIYDEFVADADQPWRSGESDLLPWGGYGVVRNGDRYALLDAGPYGTGHQHQDTLQVLGFADDDWLLVDPGTPQYSDAPETRHIRSAAGHNVVLLDGQRHAVRPERHETDEPLPIALAETGPLALTAAKRSFEAEGGTLFDHERVLCDAADAGWLVVDRLVPRDGDSHGFEWLWQSPGDWTVTDDGAIVERESGGSLRVEPGSGREWTASVERGSTEPYRGWGPTGDSHEPGPLPTLSVTVAETGGAAEMATLLSPVEASLENFDSGADDWDATLSVPSGTISVTGSRTDSGSLTAVGYDGPEGDVSLEVGEYASTAGSTNDEPV